MYPQVYTGDLFVIMKATHPDFNINIGDIIIYTNGEHTVGHRVARIYDSYYLVRGDNNQGFEQITNTQIIGKVIKTINRYNPIGQWATAQVANQ